MSRPGGPLATRPLHFIWLADCSGSMALRGKIDELNNAIAEAIPHMIDVAKNNPHATVLVRAIKFSNGAQWHHSQTTPVEQFTWDPLKADGVTDLGAALGLVAEHLKIPPMEERALPPVLALVSDGQPTDDYRTGLKKLMDEPWGRRSVRVAIAIGSDAALDVLEEFVGNPEIKVLLAKNADQLHRYIRWVSTAVLKVASSPAAQADAHTPALSMPQVAPAADDGDVW
jgi:uncharacterized protein YegL